MTPTLACVVEGYGDVRAVPLLLRRFAQSAGHHDLHIPIPVRCPRSKIIRGENLCQSELARAATLAMKKLPSRESGAVLILIDSDQACPGNMGPRILDLARTIRPDVSVGVVLANHEYEAWFVAAIESLRGRQGLGEDAESHISPESLSDPKGYLQRQMRRGKTYSETVDQPALTRIFDFSQADNCRSFRKLRKEVQSLFQHLYP